MLITLCDSLPLPLLTLAPSTSAKLPTHTQLRRPVRHAASPIAQRGGRCFHSRSATALFSRWFVRSSRFSVIFSILSFVRSLKYPEEDVCSFASRHLQQSFQSSVFHSADFKFVIENPAQRRGLETRHIIAIMSNYYDIDDILAEEELMPVVFQKAASGVGLLDPSSETNNVEQGANVELPFWLAHELHSRQAVVMAMPPCFNQMTRKEIQADAASVDLRSRCPYFYELGCKIAPQVGDRASGNFLLVAFRTRYKDVLSKAHTAAFAATAKPLTLITKEESHLYEAAQSSMVAFKKWRMGGSRFEAASVLGRKRKPVE